MDSMKKLANISLGICGASIVIPRLFILFDAQENTLLNTLPWGFAILLFGIIGIALHFWEARKSGIKFTLPSILLFSSLLLLFIGFASLEFQWEKAKFILLTGIVVLAVWLVYPNPKKEE